MPKEQNSAPKYRQQKRKVGDLAFVELCGRRFYLGRYDSSESTKEYRRVLAEWHAGARFRNSDRRHAASLKVDEKVAKPATYWFRKREAARRQKLHAAVQIYTDELRELGIEVRDVQPTSKSK